LACLVLPERRVSLVAECAYINKELLSNLPANLDLIGPISLKAALYRCPDILETKQLGRPRCKGDRLVTPREILADPLKTGVQTEMMTFDLPKGKKTLRVQVMRGVLWYHACKERRVMVVLLRDESGTWRDEVLLSTDPARSVEEVVCGYCKRWSIEVAFRDAKEYLGMQDPQVRCQESVERAHPLAFFCVRLTVLWNAKNGENEAEVNRDRPWYEEAETGTFTAMLGKLRLAIWTKRLFDGKQDKQTLLDLLEKIMHYLAAVR
jgi:hypothetical protein